MNIMTQKVFETAVDGLWAGYAAVLETENELEKLNLTFSETSFRCIKNLQDNFMNGIMDLMDIETGRRESVKASLEKFIKVSVEIYGIYKRFMEYPHAQFILFQCMDKVPWLLDSVKPYGEKEGLRCHRGISIKDLSPITGYAVEQAGRVYIIPEDAEMVYTGRYSTLLSHETVEVYPSTVTADFGITDDDGNRLFEYDVVKTGSDEFVLRPFNRYVLQHLESRKSTGLHRIRTNYDKQVQEGDLT